MTHAYGLQNNPNDGMDEPSLSVDAAVFIPRFDNYNNNNPLQQIPAYMTNCFPFVQPGHIRNQWHNQQCPPRHSYHGYQGPRKPAHRYSNVHHSDRMRGPPPNLPHAPHPPGPPPILNGPPPPPHSGTGPGLYDGQLQIYPNLSPSMPGGPAGTNVVTFADRNHAGHTLEESSIVNMRGRGRDYKGARGGRGKGSHGWGRGGFNNNNNHRYMDQQDVRNETKAPNRDFSKTIDPSSGRHIGRRTGTIIMKEVQQQTDFPQSIAYKHLTEKPSTFYNQQAATSRTDLYISKDFSNKSTKETSRGTFTGEYFIKNTSNNSSNIQSNPQNINHSELETHKIIQSNQQKHLESQKIIQLNPLRHSPAIPEPQQKPSYATMAQKAPSQNLSVKSDLDTKNCDNVMRHNPSLNRGNNLKSFNDDRTMMSNHNKSVNKHTCDKDLEKGNNPSIGKGNNSLDTRLKPEAKNIQSESKSSKSLNCENENNDSDESENKESGAMIDGEKKKRKRVRKRKRKKKSGENPAEYEEVRSATVAAVDLHFEDEDEFPDIFKSLTANAKRKSSLNETNQSERDVTNINQSERGVVDSYQSDVRDYYSHPEVDDQVITPSTVTSSDPVSYSTGSEPFSYSSILKSAPVRKPVVTFSEPTVTEVDAPNSDEKLSRKKKKRRDTVDKEADKELAEISLEQDMLRELNLKPSSKKGQKSGSGVKEPPVKVNPTPVQSSGKKTKQGMAFDLGAIIDALEKKTTAAPKKHPSTNSVLAPSMKTKKQKTMANANTLDSSAPAVKRGKERENPKPKKPSPLKKVILKEREEKKQLKLLDDTGPDNPGSMVGIGVVSAESDLSQDATAGCGGATPASQDSSPVSQNSPISMSPLSPGASPLGSEVNSPIAGAIGKDTILKIHSRRFREYCNQVLNKDIDNCCNVLLQDLVRFQDRVYKKEPIKAKSKRRFVLGLREVTKHLKLKKIKCVIVSPNLEKIQSKGGLDDALNNILNLCTSQNIPFVFALGRRSLGRACGKLVPVSTVGVFNYDGSEENFKNLMQLTEQARLSYTEMVSAIEREIREYPVQRSSGASTPHIFAHMGHSRTPSGASVLSFTSSILSEPISENYPHSEPETDSKGYEIVKDDKSMDKFNLNPKLLMTGNLPGYARCANQHLYQVDRSRSRDFDDGNEADTEDYGGSTRVRRSQSSSQGDESIRDSEEGSDTIVDLPHIDSIHHSNSQDLGAEILSQHSGRTLEYCENMSTHSSRTLGDGSSTILAEPGDRSKHGTPKSVESPSSTLQKGTVMDEERIQLWVDETQSRLEDLQQYTTEEDDSGSGSDTDGNSVDEVDFTETDTKSDTNIKSQEHGERNNDITSEQTIQAEVGNDSVSTTHGAKDSLNVNGIKDSNSDVILGVNCENPSVVDSKRKEISSEKSLDAKIGAFGKLSKTDPDLVNSKTDVEPGKSTGVHFNISESHSDQMHSKMDSDLGNSTGHSSDNDSCKVNSDTDSMKVNSDPDSMKVNSDTDSCEVMIAAASSDKILADL